jgi:hypothetical protein
MRFERVGELIMIERLRTLGLVTYDMNEAGESGSRTDLRFLVGATWFEGQVKTHAGPGYLECKDELRHVVGRNYGRKHTSRQMDQYVFILDGGLRGAYGCRGDRVYPPTIWCVSPNTPRVPGLGPARDSWQVTLKQCRFWDFLRPHELDRLQDAGLDLRASISPELPNVGA